MIPHYRRASIEGGTLFFTVTLADRSSDVLVRYIDRFRRINRMIQQRQSFETVAICLFARSFACGLTASFRRCQFSAALELIKAGFSAATSESDRTPERVGTARKGAPLPTLQMPAPGT
jgi:putative transposase